MNPSCVTTFVTAAANWMACNLSDDELEFWAAVLMQLADTLETISTVKELSEKCQQEKSKKSDDISKKSPN